MLFFKLALVLGLSFLRLVSAQVIGSNWYYLTFFTTELSGGYFTFIEGHMVVPPLPHAGTYYLWPGLQTDQYEGVYQSVLDGRSGSWHFASGWCCSNPSLPWGSGFATEPGEVNFFQHVRLDNTNWQGTIVHSARDEMHRGNFPLANKNFNQVLFAIELQGEEWDFGPLVFRDIVMVVEGSFDQRWCTDPPYNFQKRTVYTIEGLEVRVRDNGISCHIRRLVLERPA